MKGVGSDFGSVLSVLAWIFSCLLMMSLSMFSTSCFWFSQRRWTKHRSAQRRPASRRVQHKMEQVGFQTENVPHAAYSYEFIYVTSGMTPCVSVVGPWNYLPLDPSKLCMKTVVYFHLLCLYCTSHFHVALSERFPLCRQREGACLLRLSRGSINPGRSA